MLRKLCLTALICFCQYFFAQDTFSIVAVDPDTGEIGSAAASCVDGVSDDQFVDFLTAIIPNRGGIMSQAYICIPNNNLANAEAQMASGLSPIQIINYLQLNDDCAANGFNPQFSQYGIVDFDSSGNPRTAGFSGNQIDSYAEDRQGVNYSIQGNILLNVSVINNMETNFLNTIGSLADKLMAALQGANFPGADSRCLNDGTSSRLAYITVFRPDDDPDDPWLRLAVPSQPIGVEPIDVLQDLYNDFLSIEEFESISQIRLFPNPTSDKLNVIIPATISSINMKIIDTRGREIETSLITDKGLSDINFDISELQSGMYFLKLHTDRGNKTLRFIKK